LEQGPTVDEAREDPNRPMPCATDDFVPLLESNDPVMRRLLEKAKRAALSDAMILLTGESDSQEISASCAMSSSARSRKDIRREDSIDGSDAPPEYLPDLLYNDPRSTAAPSTSLDDIGSTHSEHLLESELFGHTRGAFDGAIKDEPGRLETAHGGSIFLDEIADLTAPLQTKLLHFIKEQRFEKMGSENTSASISSA
jgi:transcriptional regulator with PAS, ATPase and Fis domain